ncbi:MAG: MBL fold metallo-hydrolase [Haliscomenobacter sp.]|nr:MBL fold metallo-hydrolase [Haliscomenobacter sp.]MBK7474606.1 MBL fold metallo-hydrolase [Haliscomenobacter sp.]MBK8877746.1 MBL fold metallo-hydrolase [Haliscomenobacter sp.]
MIHVLDLHFKQLPETIASFLIPLEHGVALVETGPYATFPRLEAELHALGYSLDDVRYVFLTHIHLDHAGAAWALAERGATVYVHPFGEKHLLQPERLMQSARRIYQDEMDSLWGDMRPIAPQNLITVGHGERVDIGGRQLQAWHTPGHAVHHIVWQLENVAFTGDVGGVKIADHLVVPPCPPPDINVEDWEQSIRLLRSLDLEAMYLTHFGPVHAVSDHLSQLEEQLRSWANWMLPFYEKQIPQEEITPLFQTFVANHLKEKGIDQLGLAQYEAANPSWMSVTGLLRYWSKKLEPSA